MGLKIIWEKSEIHEDVKNLMKKETRRKAKPEPSTDWKTKDRLLVGIILIICALGTIYFWYKGQNRSFPSLWDNASLPQIDFKVVDFGETIILEN